jgi:hypothetical protein
MVELVMKARRVHLDPLEKMDLRVSRDKMDPQGPPDLPVTLSRDQSSIVAKMILST